MFFKKYTITLYQSQMYNLHVPGSVERDALKWSIYVCLGGMKMQNSILTLFF